MAESPDPRWLYLKYRMMPEALVATLPRNPERSVALRKLLEAKDAAVRAALPEEA